MIIGLSGKMQSGKDTVALICQYLYDYHRNQYTHPITERDFNEYVKNNHHLKCNWKNVKFADKLKDMVCLLLGCTREQLEDPKFKEKELGEGWEIPLQEEWKAVIGYENLYEVSNFGRVKSLNRLDSMGRVVEETIKAQHIGTTGYPAITLNKNGKKKTKVVHQLVAESFLGHIPDNYNGVINHIDNIKTNNRLDNLEVVSSRYNTQYSKSTEGVYERRNKFEVYIRIDGKKTYLGSYTSKEEALKVRNKKLKEIDTFIPLRYVARQWTPRLLLQIMGTQIGREIIHPNIWVNSLMNEYNPVDRRTIQDPDDSNINFPNWIISDVRFPNEADAIKDRNGILIRVERFCYDSSEDFLVCNPDPELRKIGIQDYNINKTLSLEEITDIAKVHGYIPLSEQHESETALDNYTDWDYILDNNGTIENLIKKVKEILIQEKIL